MQELVIISGKGGTGKTSITAALAQLAENVVLADCDVDAADLHLLMQPQLRVRNQFIGGKKAAIDALLCSGCDRCRQLCRFEAISDEYHIDALACEGCGVCVWNCPQGAIRLLPQVSGEWFISVTRNGPMVHARLGIAQENSGKLVTLVRQQARRLAEENKVEWLLVDGPPGTGCPVIASISGADGLLIVTEPTLSAMHDMQRVVALAEHFQVPTMVCINKYDINETLSRSIERYAEDKTLPMVGKIKFTHAVTKAQLQEQSVLQFGDQEIVSQIEQMWQNIRSNL